jgi:hypothetical protein
MLLYWLGLSFGQILHVLQDVSSKVPVPAHAPKMYSPWLHCLLHAVQLVVSAVVLPAHRLVLYSPAPHEDLQGTHWTAS